MTFSIQAAKLLLLFRFPKFSGRIIKGAPTPSAPDSWLLFRLQIGIFMGDVLDAGTILQGIQVMMT